MENNENLETLKPQEEIPTPVETNEATKEDNEEYILEVKNLKMYFDIATGFFSSTPLKAVDNVSFKIKKGETLGVVGESGCGKTTLGRTIMNLYKASSGEIIYNGDLISSYSDLKRIKKEAKFELNSLKYEKNKRIRNYEKSLKEEIMDGKLEEEDAKPKIEEFKAKEEEKYLKDEAELKALYEKKYNDKVIEINTNIENVIKERDYKIKNLEVVNKNDDLDAVNKANQKTAELKAKANEDISNAKKIKSDEIADAKAKLASDMAKYKELMAKNKQEVVDFKNTKDQYEDKKEYNKKLNSLEKDYTNEKIVRKEKVKGDYHIAKSMAVGKFQKTKISINEELEKNITDARSESKYYLYVDTLNNINEEAKNEIKKIKSSSRFRLKNFRKKVTMVFQDPYSSLNPRMTVQDIIAEPLDVNHLYSTKEERRSKVLELMKLVGLSPEQSTRYAHEFSGGQRQRIGIARSLAVNPEFIVCDEPVSALDVSIQAQVINTFQDLQNQLGLTYLFIAHDLLVVRHISNRIAVMYLGRMVELAETNELFENPMHPYTVSLLSAVPMPDPYTARLNKRIILEGDVPSPLNVPSGCPFRTRCPRATEACKNKIPQLKEIKKDHFVSCLLYDDEEN